MYYKKHSGFTMIEMIIVIGIIGGLMAMIMPRIMNMFGRAKLRTTQTILTQIKSDLAIFQSDIGRYPTEQEGLQALFERMKDPALAQKWRGPYSTAENENGVPVDGWKAPIVYHKGPKVFKNNNYKTYELISYGGEGRDETSDQKDWLHDGE